MSTILDLGRLVKSKYPGQYDDLSDYEVGQKVKAKYPTQYTDFTDAPDPKKEQPKQEPTNYNTKRGALQKTAGFVGVEKAGQGIATAGRVASGSINQSGDEAAKLFDEQQAVINAMHKLPVGSPERKRLADFLKRNLNEGAVTQEEIDPGTKLSNKEVAGSFANVALNIATPSAFKGSAVIQAGKNAALGAAYGAAGGLNDNKSGEDLAKSTLTGSLLAAGTFGAGELLGKAKQAITEKLPERLMNTAIKPTLEDLRKNIKVGSDTLGKELLQEKVKGSPETLLKIADTRLQKYEDQLQTVLKNSSGKIRKDALAKYLEPLVNEIAETPGKQAEFEQIVQILSELPQEMSLQQANRIKRNIYKEIRNVGYKLDANLSTKRETLKQLARGLKTEIENSVGDNTVKDINKKLSTYGKLEGRVVDLLARGNKNNLFSLTDTILAGGGFVNPLAFAALIAKKGLGSVTGKTYTANILNKASKVGTGVVGKTTKQVIRRSVYNAN
jgi:hypothetical protein